MPLPRTVTSPRLAASLAVSALLAGGCVVPVAPQWDDPEVNYPPYVVGSDPTVGEIFTPGTSDENREIAATLSDLNLDDHLFIRWLVDYPTSDTSSPHLLLAVDYPPTGKPVRSTVHIRPGCQVIGRGPGTHRLMMSVSDRKYLDALNGDPVDPMAPLDSVPDDANRIRVMWLINCP